MPDIIAVANQKGGAAKTTTAVALAAASQDSGARTLLLDMDPQATATAIWGWEPGRAQDSDLYTLLQGMAKGRPVNINAAIYGDNEREAILPATLDLAALEVELQGVMHREHILADLLKQAAAFDRIIIDCPPSFGLLTINALTAATRVVIPCVPDYVSVRGLGQLWDTIRVIQARVNPALQVAGVLVTRIHAQTLHHRENTETIAAFCEAHHIPLLGSIPNTIKVADASGAGEAVTRYSDANGAGTAYRAVADLLFQGGH